MTVIAAVRDDSTGTIYMGADSTATESASRSRIQISTGKLIHRNEMLMGVSGSSRWLHLLRYAPELGAPLLTLPPAAMSSDDVLGWFNLTFADAICSVAKVRGTLLHDDNCGDEADLNILIGYHGEIYMMSRGFSVEQMVRGYHAIGSGRDEAMGVLYTRTLDAPQDRILRALEACVSLCSEIDPPFSLGVLPKTGSGGSIHINTWDA